MKWYHANEIGAYIALTIFSLITAVLCYHYIPTDSAGKFACIFVPAMLGGFALGRNTR